MKPAYIDIMLNDKFVCQLKFEAKSDLKIIQGSLKEIYTIDKIKDFIESKMPSLKDKDYEVHFSNQRILSYK